MIFGTDHTPNVTPGVALGGAANRTAHPTGPAARWLRPAVLASAVLATVNGGIFAGFSLIVIPGLRRLSASDGLQAMQAINIAAVTAPFMLILFGGAAVSTSVGLWHLKHPGRPGGTRVIAASATFLVLVIAVTIFGNVPLNDGIATLDPHSPTEAIRWDHFTRAWNAWNLVRAAGGISAGALYVAALKPADTRNRANTPRLMLRSPQR